tara:strand:- start:207 stop:839 length:633 start_codon:yes stop_codon:yes gene_type:complete
MSNNNIENIKAYILNNKPQKLIVNQVNEEIGQFYLYLIKYLSNKTNKKIKISFDEKFTSGIDDLFGNSQIYIISLTSSKKIDEQINRNENIIIFTDYKNFKKYSPKLISINGYNNELDIANFIQNEIGISDKSLVDFCKRSPHLTFSETTKYLINNEGYIRDQSIKDETNFILDIRKKIFSLKKAGFDIRKNYLMHKEEVAYKKFNFLTY